MKKVTIVNSIKSEGTVELAPNVVVLVVEVVVVVVL